MKKNIQKINKLTGFTLIEFVVVVSIFAIMTSISMMNYNEQKTSIETSNLAEDVALTIRQAQVYGISASGYNLAGEGFLDQDEEDAFFDADAAGIRDIANDKSIRGVVFSLDKNEIILYEDNNRDYIYRKDDDRVIDTRSIVSKNVSFQTVEMCNDSSCDFFEEGVVDITFKRPYPDAIIHYRTSIDEKNADLYTDVQIFVGGDSGIQKGIHTNSIGNIVVKSRE